MKNAIPAKAARILRRVAAHILDEPRRLDMNDYAYKSSDAPCGTAACIAGWTCLLASKRRDVEAWNASPQTETSWVREPDFHMVARRLLGLTGGQAEALFVPSQTFGDGWPDKFSVPYEKYKTQKAKARVTVERIEHFIRTGE